MTWSELRIEEQTVDFCWPALPVPVVVPRRRPAIPGPAGSEGQDPDFGCSRTGGKRSTVQSSRTTKGKPKSQVEDARNLEESRP